MTISLHIYLLKQQAKRLARGERIPLHEAQRRIARREGYSSWSLLARQYAQRDTTDTVYEQLLPGELVLLGARPRHGKTLLSLALLQRALADGRDAALFSIDLTDSGVLERWQALDESVTELPSGLLLDTSEGLNAKSILVKLDAAQPGCVVVVDYLQLLDQRRETPPIQQQVSALREFARARRLTLVFIAQIDRRFDAAGGDVPSKPDVRLPNPLDLSLFDRFCFLHEGRLSVEVA